MLALLGSGPGRIVLLDSLRKAKELRNTTAFGAGAVERFLSDEKALQPVCSQLAWDF